jgi:hypothetical protein
MPERFLHLPKIGAKMNWKRGLLRLWVAGSVLWLIGVGVFAEHKFSQPFPFGENFTYVEPLKETFSETDWSKSYYERSFAPGKGKFPDSFGELEDSDVKGYDKAVKSGSKVTLYMQDGTTLYLNSELKAEDREFLRQKFWEQRWGRYLDKVWPLVLVAFSIPAAVLLFGITVRWIIKGFSILGNQ